MNYKNMDKETLIKILIKKNNRIKRLSIEKEKLQYYANIDTMTGVLNRRFGLELLSKKFYLSKDSQSIVVCFVDVDRLKRINDTFGHDEGDRLLINAAKVLKESIRNTDFVIRIGGDEFLVVFPKTTMKEVNKIWHEICRNVEEVNKTNKSYNLSLSYGFYECGKVMRKEMSIKDLIKKADEEMYKNKMKKEGILRINV